MFGYIKPDIPYLYMKDDTLYKALYCGVCKSMGKICGQESRLCLTFDIAFLSAIVHNIKGIDIKIEKNHCLVHPVTKRPIADTDDVSDKLAAVNVALAYHKICDDIEDENKGSVKKFLLKKAYKRAAAVDGVIVGIIDKNYKILRECEKNKTESTDISADPFSKMLEEISSRALGDKDSEYTRNLFYNLGKWIYLIDALDDYDKDIKKNNYNPFVCAFKEKNFTEFIKNNGNEIYYIFAEVFSAISENHKMIKFGFNHDLIDNILLRGLPKVTKNILEKGKEKNE